MAQRAGDTRSPAEYHEHLARLHKIVLDWQAGVIGVSSKRQRMADENDRYYQESVRGETGTDLTTVPHLADEGVLRLAQSAQVPIEAAEAALSAWRSAGWQSAHTDDQDEARRIDSEGRAAYIDILRTAQ